MATAEVLPPNVQLAQSTAAAFSAGPVFFSSKSITEDGRAAPASATKDETASIDYFIFSDTPFVDLQAYLVSALKLPENDAKYELLYPENVFQAHLKQHDEGLYKRTRSIITDIYQHCLVFKRDTFNTLVSTAGTIVNFSETANLQSQIARAALPVLTAPGAKLTDTNVEMALGQFIDAVSIMRRAATKASRECRDQVKAIGAFKDLTSADRSKLQDVRVLNEKYLPSIADLDTENKRKMELAYQDLKQQCNLQNQKYDQLKPLVSAFKEIQILNILLRFADVRKEIDAITGIRKATADYQKIFDRANTDLRTALAFRGQVKHLKSAMDNVLATISKAEKALNDIAGWFSKLETDLDAIESVLEQAVGHASDNKFAFQRKKAADDLDAAGQKWLKVVDLAGRFQARGIITSSDIDKKLKDELDSFGNTIDILSTNYGGNDVTEYSRAVFSYGNSLLIRTLEPGFPDPWNEIRKTISLIHSYDNQDRLYVCCENTNFHELTPGPVSGYKGSPRVAVELDPAKRRRATAKIEILAVVYGPEDVTFKQRQGTNQNVLDLIYECAENGTPVTFTNQNMGGDNWPTYQKTGVVFYRTAGGKQVRQLTGREGSSVQWEVL